MKRRKLKLILTCLLVTAGSCNDPEAIVTNIVHPDGSVLRKLEIRNQEKNLKVSNVQLPYDSTWTIRDSVEIGPKGDTTWVRRAEKLFKDAQAVSQEYKADSSFNRGASRSAGLRKKFSWFNTEFSYTETVFRKIQHGYPVSDFLSPDELKWFYSPDNLAGEKKSGPDSLFYRAIDDTVKKKVESWTIKSLVSEWIYDFARLTSASGKRALSPDSLNTHIDDYSRIIESNSKNFDSLWANGTLVREILGEKNAVEYRAEADSALKTATDQFFFDFRNYTLRTLMPGKLTSATGIVDSSGYVVWPVKSDFFMTQDYVMKAESKTVNLWAWIVSGVFLLFVISGIAFRKIKKG